LRSVGYLQLVSGFEIMETAKLWHGLVHADPPPCEEKIVSELDGADIITARFPNCVEINLEKADHLRGKQGADTIRKGLARALSCFPLAGARVLASNEEDERTWRLEALRTDCAAELRIYDLDQELTAPSLPIPGSKDGKVFGSRMLIAAVQVFPNKEDTGSSDRDRKWRARFVLAGCHYLFDATTMCHFVNLWSACTQSASDTELDIFQQNWPLHKSTKVPPAPALNSSEELRLCNLMNFSTHPNDTSANDVFDAALGQACTESQTALKDVEQTIDLDPAQVSILKDFVHSECLKKSGSWASTHEIIMALVLQGLADVNAKSACAAVNNSCNNGGTDNDTHRKEEGIAVPFAQVVSIRARSEFFPSEFTAGNPIVRILGEVTLKPRSKRTVAEWLGESVYLTHKEVRRSLNSSDLDAEYRLHASLRHHQRAREAAMSRPFSDAFMNGGVLFNSWCLETRIPSTSSQMAKRNTTILGEQSASSVNCPLEAKVDTTEHGICKEDLKTDSANADVKPVGDSETSPKSANIGPCADTELKLGVSSWFSAKFGADRVISVQEPSGHGHAMIPGLALVLPSHEGCGRKIVMNLSNPTRHASVNRAICEALEAATKHAAKT